MSYADDVRDSIAYLMDDGFTPAELAWDAIGRLDEDLFDQCELDGLDAREAANRLVAEVWL